MQGEGEEAAFLIAPVVLMPGDILGLEELCTAQQGVLPPELDQPTAQQALAMSLLVTEDSR